MVVDPEHRPVGRHRVEGLRAAAEVAVERRLEAVEATREPPVGALPLEQQTLGLLRPGAVPLGLCHRFRRRVRTQNRWPKPHKRPWRT